MRKITACEFITLDGVIQNEENDGDGFKHGGWFFGYADDATETVIKERLAKPVDLLLGRKTFDIWEPYWPENYEYWPNVMSATKYVASNTRDSSKWEPTVFLGGDLAGQVRELKLSAGPDIHIFGSADMLQTLLKADLVDRLELMIFPVTLGSGKRLFQEGTIPASFKVTEGQISPSGIVIAAYERDGDVRSREFEPSEGG